MISNNTYGYIRVSTREQNEDRQMIAMREFGVPAEHQAEGVMVRTQFSEAKDREIIFLELGLYVTVSR